MILVIQWHITELCNWRCKHCYHDKYLEYWPSLEQLKDIYKQITTIQNSYFWKIDTFVINFIWWEPFIRNDFLDLLEYINNNTKYLQIWILTNGSLLTKEILDKLKTFSNLNIWFQISIEWTQEVNDNIRWKGSFKKIFDSIKLIKDNDFYVELSLTLTNNNKKHIIALMPFLKKSDVLLKIRRLVAMGQSDNSKQLILDKKEMYALSKKLTILSNRYFKWVKNARISFDGCSEMLSYNYNWIWCWINDHRILIILENLDVMACRKLDVVLWNLKDKKLKDLYFDNKYIDLINSYKNIKECRDCSIYNKCKWWAKCITHSLTRDIYKPDPGCIIIDKINKK